MKSPDACGRVDETPTATSRIELGGRGFTLAKGILRAETRDDDRTARVGVVSDVDTASADSLAALAEIVAGMGKGLDAVVVPGGLGEAPEAVARALAVLAGSGAPVFVGLGARATRAGLATALGVNPGTALALCDVRVVEGDDFTLVPVPGHYLAKAVPPDGCRTGDAELARVAEAARGAPEPRVLVSHAPPRVGGAAGIDRAGPVAIGSLRLGSLLVESGVHFGVFGDVPEAAGTASDRKGAAVPPGAWVGELLLNAGAVDLLPPAGGAGTGRGSAVASVLELDSAAGTARWERIAPAGR